MIFIEFPRNLKQIRRAKGLLQEEFAKKLEISIHTLQAYEQGVREPNFQTLEKIKIALDCSYDDLLR